MSTQSPATRFAVAVLGEFIRLGVRDIVVSPGSRSQALALAAAEFERSGAVRLHVRIDERVAAFLALGLAIESGMPALVITTSGTAVANLHPAVLEAHHAGVPLILLTADRPTELHGIGSNQTTVQTAIFGHAVRMIRDVEAPTHGSADDQFPAAFAREALSAALGHSSKPGPVQLNIAFREPLSGTLPPLQKPASTPPPDHHSVPHPSARPIPLHRSERTVVIAGHGAGEQAEAAARVLGAPLIAEVTSGAHFGPNLVVAYRQLLNTPEFGGGVRRVIVFGHPTLSREVPALIARDGVETIVVRGTAFDDYNPSHRVSRFVDAVELPDDVDRSSEARSWPGSWVAASRALLAASAPVITASADPRTDDTVAVAEFAREQLAAFREPVTRRMLVEAVWQVTWPHDRLVFGASRLIREADRAVTGKKLRVHANRGLSGIDGTLATATGIAVASQAGDGRAGVTRVVLGDLALLHDVGALLFGHGEWRPRLQVIVGNDGGGTIFDELEVAATAKPENVDRVMFTPHTVTLAALAAAYGWQHLLARNRGELDQALTAIEGTTLIEVPLQRR